MKKSSLADEEYNLWILLYRVREAIFKARQKELAKYDVSATQAAVLHIIKTIGQKATPYEISQRLLREPHSVSELLSRMEKQGLIKKVNDLGRKNMIRAVLTKKGLEAYCQSVKQKSIHRVISSLSEEERQQMRSCLRILHNKALKELRMRR